MFTAIGIITTIVLARFAMRAMHYRWHRRHGFAGFGPFGGCGGRHARWHRHWHGPIRLGDFGDDAPYGSPSSYGDFDGADLRSPRPESILQTLELNDRQKAEATDVLTILRGTMGERSQLAMALRAASREKFDTDLAATAIGPRVSPTATREALDALEHLHIILTEEQRQALDRATARA